MKKKKSKEKGNIFIKILMFVIIFLFCIFIYSKYIGTTGLIIKEYSYINSKLPGSFQGFKIVHFSDLHYGSTINFEELQEIVKKINELNPDIIVFTGDLINKNYKTNLEDKDKIITTLNKLDPKIKMYSVKGEEDNNDDYTSIITQTNFIEMDNHNTLIYYNDSTPIKIVGLDSSLSNNINIQKAFTDSVDEYFTILLAHEPDTLTKLKDYRIDLMLSGHSHNGQIRLPFIGSIYKIDGAKTYYDHLYKIDDTTLYISGGLGTSKFGLRLFNKPSINFYRFYTT